MDFKKHTGAIVTGVISGLLVLYLFEPIISFLGKIVVTLSDYVYVSYLDAICSDISAGEPNIGFSIFGVISGYLTAIATGVLVGFAVFKLQIWRSKSDYKGTLSSYLSVGLSGGQVATFTFLFITFISMALFVDGYIRIKIYNTFRQSLAIVAPYITDSQHKEYISRFSLMKNKSDYDLIMKDMASIAADKKITLPKNILNHNAS